MRKFLYTIIAFLGFSTVALAQTGEIQGKVVDEKGEPMPFAQLIIVLDAAGTKTTSKGTKANINGLYTLKGLAPGKYNLMCKALGKDINVEVDIEVAAGRTATVNFTMEPKGNIKKTVTVKAVRKNPPIINVDRPKETIIGAAEIKESSVRDVNSLAGATGGVVQEDVGAALSVGGGRSEGVTYIIDGVKIQGGAPNIAPGTIQNLEVITSGVPAKYGDANAGVISIVTKGPASKIGGSVEGLTSQFLDPYAYNLVGFNLSGPLLFRKAPIDSNNPTAKREKEPMLGFFVSGEYQSNGDRFPTINGNWKVKDNVYSDIQENPYKLSEDGTQLLLRQSFLTQNDLERTNSHQNTSGRTFRLNGKLDWKVIPGKTNITIGARYDDDQYNDYIQRYSLLNFQNNRVIVNKGMSGFIRLYQPLSDPNKQANKIIKDAAMTLQADFSSSGQTYSSPVGGFDPWSYGYVGKFEEIKTKQVTRTEGGDGTRVYYAPNQYLLFGDNLMTNSYTSTGVRFTPGTVNPLAANQMQKFISTWEQNIGVLTSINAIDNAGGVINGKRASSSVFDLFSPAARIYNGIQKEANDQYRITGNFNFDIVNNKSANLNKHTIEAGFELEQRVNSRYQLSPNTLWTTAQSSLLNAHLNPDNAHNYNPWLIMKGGTVRMRLQDYIKQVDTGILFAPFDTIFYDVEVSNGQQTNFSKNLREALGYDSLVRLNIHELDPSKMKLEWLSPDDLINNSFGVTGYGYDVYGNKLSTSTSFQDFFTARDNKGNLKREVTPYMPRYGAAYIQDKFQLKDISFNVGFRLDYFDANAYQFIDPYIPQGGRTIQDADVKTLFGSKIPTNLPSDAVVYVDNETSPTRMTGFRVGNRWYDKTGNELLGPDAIKLETGTDPIPYLAGNTAAEREKRVMGSSTFDPNLMFKKTSGQFAFAPRVNFSFTIDSSSLLFAHYDVLNQRPEQDATVVNALDYYQLVQRSQTSGNPAINNAALGFSSTSDIELGFKQRLTRLSSITINFLYREYSNMVSLARMNGAYPGSYNTWGNTDFQTVKSIGLAYEMRRTKNLRLRANYTMQFSDGTGSSRTAQANLISSGQGNIKVIFPLNNDTRHQFNFNANYSFGKGKGSYFGPAKWERILQNSGVTLDLNLRSGTPYTLQSNSTPEAFMNSSARAVNLGDINAGSMPWRFNVNLKLDKDFTFAFGKETKDDAGIPKPKREYGLNLYLQITNLLNTANSLSVYRFTGSSTSDGYLSSDAGILQYNQNELVAKGYGQAFRDLYNVALEIPNDRTSMYARPRVIQLGGVLSF